MLRHTRNTYQRGWIATQPCKNKELVFVYRWRERRPEGGYIQRSRQIGLVSDLKTTANARRAAEHFRFEVNGKIAGKTFTFAALCERYLSEETSGLEITTRTWYRPWFRNHIIPKWGEMWIEDIKPFAVREWLNGLHLSRKSRSHIRDQMKQV